MEEGGQMAFPGHVGWGGETEKDCQLWLAVVTTEGRTQISYDIRMSFHHPLATGSLGMSVLLCDLTSQGTLHPACCFQVTMMSFIFIFHAIVFTNLAK